MRERLYEPPMISDLGTVSDLTLMPTPPGKSGPLHDGSQFLSNFSCVSSDDNCGGGGGAPK